MLDFKDPELSNSDALSEATEMEYLRKVLFEYMMGRETKVCLYSLTARKKMFTLYKSVVNPQ